MMRKVTLGLGLCDCIIDWHGKFNNCNVTVNGIQFHFKEEIIRDGRGHRNHIWIDRHYYEPFCLKPGEYETIIDFRMGEAFQPYREYHPEVVFASSYPYMMTTRWYWIRTPSTKEVVEKIRRMLTLAIQKHDFEEWLQSFAKIVHLPLLR